MRVLANVLQTKMDAGCDKLATVELSSPLLRRSTCHGEKAENSAEIRVWDMVTMRSVLVCVTAEFPYNAV